MLDLGPFLFEPFLQTIFVFERQEHVMELETWGFAIVDRNAGRVLVNDSEVLFFWDYHCEFLGDRKFRVGLKWRDCQHDGGVIALRATFADCFIAAYCSARNLQRIRHA